MLVVVSEEALQFLETGCCILVERGREGLDLVICIIVQERMSSVLT